MPVRVLIAEFLHETNTFSVQKTDRKCFERGLYLDNEVSKAFRNTRTFMGAGYEAAEKFGWQPVTPLVAEASPSGRVTDACFEEFTARLLSIAKEVDGILLHLHGAMSTESHDDGEGELLARLRSVVGSDIPIVVVIDLHATVTQRMADNANALIAYRTYPHVDQYERGHQAAELLDRAIAGDIRPKVVVARLEEEGYRVIQAATGREALALIATHPEISLLFTDIVMPGGMFGDELAREARMLRPDLKVLFTSGYAEPSLAGRELAEGSWLKKPYTSKELAARLRSLLD